jgi:hypothetical protein
MTIASVRTWLLKQPRPATVRIKRANEVQTLTTDGGQTWQQIATTIVGFEAETIDALDAKSGLIRSTTLDAIDDTETGSGTSETTVGSRLVLDAETARYKIFAEHVAEAYRFATGVAFERMVDLFSAVNRRSESLEKSLEATHRLLGKAYQEQIDNALQKAEGDDPVTNLLGAFMTGATQGAAEKSAVVPTNGKGKH